MAAQPASNYAVTCGPLVPSLNCQSAASSARNRLENMCLLNIESVPSTTRLTGIVCTIGPSTRNVEMMEKMIAAGMTCARFNFSHGSHEYHEESMKMMRTAAERAGKHIPLALDTKGPEIRTGVVKKGENAEIKLAAGAEITVTTDPLFKDQCDESHLWIDYSNLVKVMEVGKRILISDGLIALVVLEKGDNALKCQVENGGSISSKKNVNLPGTPVDLPAVSEQDVKDLQFGVRVGVDMIFASFIRDRSGVQEMRRMLGKEGKSIKIIAKIENAQGIKNFDEILDEVDGVMVARGDLGSEIPNEKLFVAQKMIIGKCNRIGKPVICATQMLESMTDKPRPTRAEITDVANAVLDGADCVMLSGETAKGLYPLVCIDTMHRICLEAESALHYSALLSDLRDARPQATDVMHATAIGAVEAAANCSAAAIMVITSSGRSAMMVASYRPKCPVLAITRSEHVSRYLRIIRGTLPVYLKSESPGDDWNAEVDYFVCAGLDYASKNHIIKPNSYVVVVTGIRMGNNNQTSNICVMQVNNCCDTAGKNTPGCSSGVC